MSVRVARVNAWKSARNLKVIIVIIIIKVIIIITVTMIISILMKYETGSEGVA